jgi:DNA-binding HxlR family transcriptional regulator
MKKKADKIAKKRSDCPISCSLDLLGDKWSLLIIRDMLYLGKTTYNEFLSSREGIATNILKDRLNKLTEDGFITFSGSEKRKVYELTKKGLDLRSVLESVAHFGIKYSSADREFLKHVKKTMKL